MKIYHTATQEDYDALMIDVETGKTSDEILKFLDFVFEFVVIPVLLEKEKIGADDE